jgi:hypothetical protein
MERPSPKPSTYRIYIFDGRGRVELVACETDAQAVAQARAVGAKRLAEIWHFGRLVARTR